MRLKVRDERWAEARERSRAEQSESEKSRVQQYAKEPNEENMRETPPYIGREARQMSEWEMHGWTGNARVNNLLHTDALQMYYTYYKQDWESKLKWISILISIFKKSLKTISIISIFEYRYSNHRRRVRKYFTWAHIVYIWQLENLNEYTNFNKNFGNI